MAIVSMLAQVADSKASQAANAASPLVPSGVILPYGGNTAPTGWLECNGQEVSQTTYSELFAALGTIYNTQLNPVTGANWAAPAGGNFRVPDMRGMFLRGEGTPSGLDAVSVGENQTQKTKPNGLTNSDSNTVSGTAAGQTQAAGSNVNLTSGSVSINKNQWNSDQTAHEHQQSVSTGQSGVATVSQGAVPFGTARQSSVNNTFSASASWNSVNASGTASGTTDIAHTHGSSALTATAAAPTISGDNETRPINRGVKYIIKV